MFESSGSAFSLLLTMTNRVKPAQWFLEREIFLLLCCSALKNRSPEQGRSDVIRCPEGGKEAEIPLASLRSGPNMDTHALLFTLPFLKVPGRRALILMAHRTRPRSAGVARLDSEGRRPGTR